MDAPARVGDYAIAADMGDGSHGTFYLATPPARLGDVGTQVVVKLVPGGDDAAFRRFTRELRLFNRVQNDHLVRLFDAGQHEDWFFYSMEWCEGGTLAAADDAARSPRHAPCRAAGRGGGARTARARHRPP